MARLVVLAVLDVAVQTFSRPSFARSKAEAIRSFTDEVNRKGEPQYPSPMFDHPEDYRLFCLGEYEDATGKFIAPELPELLVDAVAVSQRHNEVINRR